MIIAVPIVTFADGLDGSTALLLLNNKLLFLRLLPFLHLFDCLLQVLHFLHGFLKELLL